MGDCSARRRSAATTTSRRSGKEVVARGFTALKTNIVIPGEPATVYFPGFASGINTTDGAPTVEMLGAVERLIGTFRDAVGPEASGSAST